MVESAAQSSSLQRAQTQFLPQSLCSLTGIGHLIFVLVLTLNLLISLLLLSWRRIGYTTEVEILSEIELIRQLWPGQMIDQKVDLTCCAGNFLFDVANKAWKRLLPSSLFLYCNTNGERKIRTYRLVIAIESYLQCYLNWT